MAIILLTWVFFMKPIEGFTPGAEGFTPGLRKIYRPYIRNSRIYISRKYNSLSSKLRAMLARYGII
jgi:hypothetical protein